MTYNPATWINTLVNVQTVYLQLLCNNTDFLKNVLEHYAVFLGQFSDDVDHQMKQVKQNKFCFLSEPTERSLMEKDLVIMGAIIWNLSSQSSYPESIDRNTDEPAGHRAEEYHLVKYQMSSMPFRSSKYIFHIRLPSREKRNNDHQDV